MVKKKYVSKADALIKLQRYCAYQERCHQEVRSKLIELGIFGDDLEDIIADLISENFLNEERFARSFARGKFRMKQWGKTRIRQELQMRKVSDYCLRKAMEEIPQQEYLEALRTLIEKKMANLPQGKSDFEKKSKLAQYAIQRGFETDLVWSMLE